MGRWGAEFDPDRLADLETAMWKAYYRRQPARLFGHLLQGLREQGQASWPRAIAASLYLTRAAARFARSTGDYDRFVPDIARGYRLLGLPATVDARRGRPAGAPLVGRPPRDRARRRPGGWRRDHPPVRRDLRAARDRGRRGRTAPGRGGRGPRSGRHRRSGRSDRSRSRLLAGGGAVAPRVVSLPARGAGGGLNGRSAAGSAVSRPRRRAAARRATTRTGTPPPRGAASRCRRR